MVELISNKGPNGEPVTYADGTIASGVRIIAYHTGGENASDGDTFTTTTDSNGEYAFTDNDLPPTYGSGNTAKTDYVHLFAEIGSSGTPRQATPIRPYQPYSLATQLDTNNLFARYDATEISGVSDGSDLSSWSDQQGSNDLTAGVPPTYESSGINGNPSVVFNGVDEYLNTSFTEISQPTHIFFVGQHETFDGGDRNFIFDSTSSAGRLILQNALGNRELFAGSTSITGGSTDDNIHVFSALCDGSNSELRVDGVQDVSGDAGTDGLGGLTLATNFDNSINFANFRFGEVLVYSADKSSKISDIESYLADKWGVTF